MQESYSELLAVEVNAPVTADAVRLFHFRLFLYSSHPWTEERVVVGALVTDGNDATTVVRGAYRSLPSACHFSQCVEHAAKGKIMASKVTGKDLLDVVGCQAVDKGTAMGFGHSKSICASSLDDAIARIAECYFEGDTCVLSADLACS